MVDVASFKAAAVLVDLCTHTHTHVHVYTRTCAHTQ